MAAYYSDLISKKGFSMKYIVVCILLLSAVTKAQEIKLNGNLYSDSRIVMQNYKTSTPVKIFYQEKSKKSPFIAGLLSAVLPGAGEFYTGNYWKAAAFLLIEGGAIYTAIDYNKKGDNQTNYFQHYADENWSVVRYAEWLNTYHSANISINPDQSLPPWKRVSFNQVNQYEVGSHKLPSYGEQQYYELIGKYHQFAAGWDDFGGGTDVAPQPSPHFIGYSIMRGDANDLYNVSDKAVIVIYINHILSAADAVWSAISFNKNLTVNVRMQENNFVYTRELAPVMNIKYNF